MEAKKELIIDGNKFKTFKEFVEYMNSIAFTKEKWNGNLDALNDFITGGFDNEIEGKSIRIINSYLFRKTLGIVETKKWIEQRINKCHPDNIEYFKNQLITIDQNSKDLLSDKVLEIFKDHSRNFSNCIDSEIPELIIE